MGEYLRRFLDPTDPKASLKHAAYAVVILSSVGWLSWDLTRGPIDAAWVSAFGLLLAAVTTAKVAGAAPDAGGQP